MDTRFKQLERLRYAALAEGITPLLPFGACFSIRLIRRKAAVMARPRE
jgi:hypothetical protein